MSVIEIEEVKREGAKLLIMLCGVSGGGKTYTALQLALGLAQGDCSKIAFMDTENGRGKLYANSMPAPYKYGQLRAPFSPERYIGAINDFEKINPTVLVIDSGSHEWNGIGGCEAIAKDHNGKLDNWKKAKAEHKKFMAKLLSTPMHVILCLRAQEKTAIEPVFNPKKNQTEMTYVSKGLHAITEKNVLFEATISLMIHENGKRQDVIKCPDELKHIMGRGKGYLTPADGEALLNWVNGGEPIDQEVNRAMYTLQGASENGMKALHFAWENLPVTTRQKMGGCPEELKEAAKAFDNNKTQAEKVNDLIQS